MFRLVAGFLIALTWNAGLIRGDVVIRFSSSAETFTAITEFSIMEGSSGSALSNRVYLFAEGASLSSNNGLGGFKLGIGSAGSIANIGTADNMGINVAFDYRSNTYEGGVGTMEASMNDGGVAATSNRVYLGYFGLNGDNAGSASLAVTADTNPGSWFDGNLNDLTVNPSTSSLNVTVTAVPEPGTILLTGSALALGVGCSWFRRKKGLASSEKGHCPGLPA